MTCGGSGSLPSAPPTWQAGWQAVAGAAFWRMRLRAGHLRALSRVWQHRQNDVRGETRRAPDALPAARPAGVALRGVGLVGANQYLVSAQRGPVAGEGPPAPPVVAPAAPPWP